MLDSRAGDCHQSGRTDQECKSLVVPAQGGPSTSTECYKVRQRAREADFALGSARGWSPRAVTQHPRHARTNGTRGHAYSLRTLGLTLSACEHFLRLPCSTHHDIVPSKILLTNPSSDDCVSAQVTAGSIKESLCDQRCADAVSQTGLFRSPVLLSSTANGPADTGRAGVGK
jgi:hypothetical protein